MSMQFSGGGVIAGTPVAIFSSNLAFNQSPIIPDVVTGVGYRANYSTGQKSGGGSVTYAANAGIMGAMKTLGCIVASRGETDATISNGTVSVELDSPVIAGFNFSCDAMNNGVVQATTDFRAKGATFGGSSPGTPPSQASFIPQFQTGCSGSLVSGNAVRFSFNASNDIFTLYLLDAGNDGTPNSLQYGLLRVTGSLATYGGGPTITGATGSVSISGVGTSFSMANVLVLSANGDVTGPNEKPFQMISWEAIGNGATPPVA